MDGGMIGLRLASAVVAPLLKKLVRRSEPGAGLAEGPVRIGSLLVVGAERDAVSAGELRKPVAELVDRAARAAGPHEAPDAEVRAELSEALLRSLTALGELEMDDVQAVSLGPEELARRVRRPGDLSAAADVLYEPVLLSVCTHLIDHFTRRSTFVARTLVEQTRQARALVDRLDVLAERLPSRTAADAAFEERYARWVVDTHDHVTIHGIDVGDRWPLDDAYLSLETTTTGQDPGGVEDELGGARAAPQRAEAALRDLDRALLRGGAGSGKTTLVQWLAVLAARQRGGAGALDLRLAGRVPLVLPLRRLTRRGAALPRPADIPAAIDCPHSPPEGWVERVLNAGRGLLLVDGIDEVPESERGDVRQWLVSLVRAFPDCLWLVTARPSAVGHDWLADAGFGDLSLAPMSGTDTETFVRRWHTAARLPEQSAGDLLDALHRRPDLSRLATNPLMCGLICALHHTRHGYLPRGREALYQAALQMLLERRDQERRVRAGVELDAATQILLLQRLAYWLIRNERAEMEREDAVDVLADALPGMPALADTADAAQLYRFLLERSGLLREPADGVVDFVHRTFQDYLAAKAAIEARDIPWLVRQAHKDQFEDVIRMAVAHGRPGERDRLLRQLVKRGDTVRRHRIRLHLLAVACLEHAAELSPEVRDLVRERARQYLPPRCKEEAEALAQAGPIILDLLPGPEGLTEDEQVATVRTVTALGGTDHALSVLRRHRATPAVAQQLADAWDLFDTDRYYEEVVRHLAPAGLTWWGRNNRMVELSADLSGPRGVTDSSYIPLTRIADFLNRHSVAMLDLRGAVTATLPWLRGTTSLESLILCETSSFEGSEVLRELDLNYLQLQRWGPDPFGRRVFEELSGLETVTQLAFLNDVPLRSLDQLPSPPLLRYLRLPDHPPPLDGIGALTGLEHLSVWGSERAVSHEELRAIATLRQLTDIDLGNREVLTFAQESLSLPTVKRASLLKRMDSAPAANVSAVAEVFPQLESLHFGYGLLPEDLSPLRDLPRLRSVRCSAPHPGTGLPEGVEFSAPPAPRY
ncbi:NACHT domain-containing protein [Streptomyces spiramenti]|uniref:NACHT domain-containing protein n=1 Tax=Streptomyces spiramenti TaxID=2720606 RepID=A0ABX1AR91_9ACTN|nr:NACHT domain-containing protein [Streptomyces spiramenti]NJP67575.1 NACHT domain-containing protein [Streptomyces spiramenti]